jgi:hypothetical protein
MCLVGFITQSSYIYISVYLSVCLTYFDPLHHLILSFHPTYSYRYPHRQSHFYIHYCYYYHHSCHHFRSTLPVCDMWYVSFSAWLIPHNIMSSAIHFPANNITSFFMTEQYYMNVYYIFFIHSSVFGHLDWFHRLALVNSVAVNLDVQVSLQTYVQE